MRTAIGLALSLIVASVLCLLVARLPHSSALGNTGRAATSAENTDKPIGDSPSEMPDRGLPE